MPTSQKSQAPSMYILPSRMDIALKDERHISSEFVGCQKALEVKSACGGLLPSLSNDASSVFYNLPAEVLFQVLSLLSLDDLCGCRRVSRKWCDLTNEYLRCLQTINFVPMQPILTAFGLKSVLKYIQNLRVLRLETCWKCVNEENLLIVATNCPKLRVLTLSRCKGVTDNSLKALARNCQEIEELDLSSCFQISDEGILAIGEHCGNLRELHISSCYGVTDDSVALVSMCCSKLYELDVSWCYKVTDSGLREFLGENCQLKLLRIKNCPEVSQDLIAQLMDRGVSVNCFF